MKKSQVSVHEVYSAKVSGAVVPVRILAEMANGCGWWARNLKTGRDVRIKTAPRLRRHLVRGTECARDYGY